MPILSRGDKVGEYIVQNLIKENLYTETYRAEDKDGNPFFLKVFILKRVPEKLINSETNKVYEIEYSRNIKHKNIISFIDSGTIEKEESSCQYYLTTYLSGELLSEKLKREGTLSEDEAIEIYKGVLEGLHCMHKQGLCHNDITPHNIMLSATTNGVPEIIDLGHTSPRSRGKVSFDTTDLELFYSANETFAGIYDEQSDIFSATVLLFVMLFGEIPWDTELPESAKRGRKAMLLKEYRKDNPIDFSTLNVSDRIKVVLAKGLSISTSERYDDIVAIFKDLNADQLPDMPSPKEKSSRESSSSQSSGGSGYNSSHESPNKVDFEIKKGNGNGFKDIAGMNDLKEYLSQRVIFVIKNAEQVEKYKLSAPNGMLLYGPPGCGKTYVAEKFAEETGFNFIVIKSSDLASSFVHGSQEKIAQLFKQAEKHSPIVICFDEFDALVPDRSNYAAQHSSGEVNEFLSQLNNCSKKGIFVIGTTNRPDKIDPAVLRTGRIDKMVYVPMPDKDARKGMFMLHLSGRPFNSEEIDFDKLSDLTEGYIASDIAYVVNDAALIAAFTNKDITQELLEEAIKNTRPSLRSDIMKVYDEIRDRMENKERENMARPRIGYIN